MKDINEVRLRGRIGNAKILGNGKVLSLSLATTESYKDRNGKWQEVTTWHRIKAFSSNSNLPPFDLLERGMYIMVSGKLATNKFTDRDGNERETVEVDAAEIVAVQDLKESEPRQQGGHSYNDEDF